MPTVKYFILILFGIQAVHSAGFGLVSNGLISSLTNSSLREAGANLQLIQISETVLASYGPTQFWGDQQSSMLLYHVDTQNWSAFGGLVATHIDGVLGVTGNNFVVVGNIALSDNPLYSLNNIAYCNWVTNQCESMGNGLPDYGRQQGMEYSEDAIYISYLNNAGNITIAMWAGNTWTVIFNQLYQYSYIPSTITYVNDTLYATVVNGEFTDNKCDDNETINLVAYWNGVCWSGMNVPQKVLIAYIFSDEENLYGIFTFGEIVKYVNNNWESLVSTELNMNFPLYVSNGAIYFENYPNPLTIGAFNLTTKEINLFNKTICPHKFPFVMYDNVIWYSCQVNETLPLTQLNPVSQAVVTVSCLSDITFLINNIGGMCAVKGGFMYAGNVKCPNSIAIWNGTDWNNLSEPEGLNSYTIVQCGTTDSDFVIIYRSSNNTLKMAIINGDSSQWNTYNAPQAPIYENFIPSVIQIFATVSDIYLLYNSPYLYIFDRNSSEWNTEIFSIGMNDAINTILVQDDIMYLAGCFTLNETEISYYNFARKNIITGEWLPADPLPTGGGCVSDIQAGVVAGSNATLYIVGSIQSGNYSSIAGINDEGQLINNLANGLPQYSCSELVYDNASYYIICSAGPQIGASLFIYNGSLQLIGSSIYMSVYVTPESVHKHIAWYWYLIGGVSIAVVVAVIAAIVIRVRRRKLHKYSLIPRYQELNDEHNVIRIVKNIKLMDQIGSGQFGDVYKALMENTTTVAVKVLKSSQTQEIEKEVSVLCYLNHPNIVRLYGIHLTTDSCMMVLEYIPNGNLLNLLHANRNTISVADIYTICTHIVNGMIYLEDNNIVHRDLACRNVLIGQDSEGKFIAKISDFGLSRALKNDYYRTDEKTMPVKWTAIESIKYGIFTSKSDVWSFGVCLWELFSYGMVPYPGMINSTVIEKVASGYRLASPEGCPAEAYVLMCKCWSEDPLERPSFEQIAEKVNMWNTNQQSSSLMASVIEIEDVSYN